MFFFLSFANVAHCVSFSHWSFCINLFFSLWSRVCFFRFWWGFYAASDLDTLFQRSTFGCAVARLEMFWYVMLRVSSLPEARASFQMSVRTKWNPVIGGLNIQHFFHFGFIHSPIQCCGILNCNWKMTELCVCALKLNLIQFYPPNTENCIKRPMNWSFLSHQIKALLQRLIQTFCTLYRGEQNTSSFSLLCGNHQHYL